ncbi:MAG: HigA family addiction module antidote protein [Deltaproteobacteria bacterium]|nr:HigA family addiction module antidote protein [Deltaproteobacteria bacterium]
MARQIAEAFPPGEFIQEELEARDWKQVDLAAVIDCPPKVINELVLGKRAITPDTAKALADAFGTSAQYWMNLQSEYQLWKTKNFDESIAHRAQLYSFAPIKEMLKRGWIEPSENVDVLEARVLKFFEVGSLDQKPYFSHAARKTSSDPELTQAQSAWLFRAKHLAQGLHAASFSVGRFNEALDRLKVLLEEREEIRRIPKILAECGIRLVILEPLPKTQIDGVTFWLDENSPVIALSIRFDRIDWFWHTLSHELGHVNARDGLRNNVSLDTDLVGEEVQPGEDKSENEKLVDLFACEFLVQQAELENFIRRVRPLYGRMRVMSFAKRIRVHPGIVVGQLQHRKQIHWSYYRGMLDKVRHIITQSALTDGWGHKPILN